MGHTAAWVVRGGSSHNKSKRTSVNSAASPGHSSHQGQPTQGLVQWAWAWAGAGHNNNPIWERHHRGLNQAAGRKGPSISRIRKIMNHFVMEGALMDGYKTGGDPRQTS